MPKKQLSKDEYVAAEAAKAAERWEQRARHPKVMGRRSHREADRNAIAEIMKTSGGYSGPKMKLWTQAEWIKKVGTHKGVRTPGRVTIIKHLKEFFSRNLIPMHLWPAKMVQAMPPEARWEHLYDMALAEAGFTASRKGQKFLSSCSITFSMVDDIHRRLCTEHLWKMKRLPEAQRHAWCEKKWTGTSHVHLESRNQTPTTPRGRKTL